LQFRSYTDLARLISESSDRIRGSFDIVIGIPRSGLVPAAMIALLHNKPLADLDGFIQGQMIGRGHTRSLANWSEDPGTYRRALVVDDSVNKGTTFDRARGRLEELDFELSTTFLAAYAHERSSQLVDICLEICPKPRIFEWNMLHAWLVERACFDLDGVLCRDPSSAENDDGAGYREFVQNVPPLAIPTRKIRRIVTSRLERYRPETERWLAKNDVAFDHLHMLDLPSAAERRAQGAHATFKAETYAAASDTVLFIESDPRQAVRIAELSGKPVLDYRNKQMVMPDRLTIAYGSQQTKSFFQRVRRALERRMAGTSRPHGGRTPS
jgi:uncharacterized HAD superfamily protein/hypoxanthine phosphoribosyltransferase